jgi:predicted glycoside hydrolase/deacetylase ChbG (UPF0249 family)
LRYAGRVIINADDFGMTSEINAAIVEAFHKRWISSTTIMANMPGTEEAFALARRYNLIGCIGIHLNLTEGYPITKDIAHFYRFCDEKGRLRPRRTMFHLSTRERLAVEHEIDAQVEKCLNHDIPLTHIDCQAVRH